MPQNVRAFPSIDALRVLRSYWVGGERADGEVVDAFVAAPFYFPATGKKGKPAGGLFVERQSIVVRPSRP